MTCTEDKSAREFLVPAIYVLSSLVLAVTRYYVPYEQHSVVALLLLFFPLGFLFPFVRFLLQEATKRQAIKTIFLNGLCALSAAGYLASRPFWPPVEIPFELIVILAVIVPTSFVLAAIALFLHHKTAYVTGLIASFLIWPCLLLDSLAQRNVGPYGVASLGAILAVLGFAMATSVIFLRSVVAYRIGLISAIFEWPYLVLRETSYPYHGNSWIMFNLPLDPMHGNAEQLYATLTIFAVVLVVASAFASLLRLSTAPIRRQNWPIFAGCLIVTALWFAHSVTPYRLPTEHGGVSPEIRVIHIEKKGLHFRETQVAVMRDGKVYICSDIREPLRYRSDGKCARGEVPLEEWQPVIDLAKSPSFRAAGGQDKTAHKSWNSDSWYVYGDTVRLVVFSSANKTNPPAEIVDWFNSVSKTPTGDSWHFSTRDVCLGLCYEPQF